MFMLYEGMYEVLHGQTNSHKLRISLQLKVGDMTNLCVNRLNSNEINNL